MISEFDIWYKDQLDNILVNGWEHRGTRALFNQAVTLSGAVLPLLSLRKLPLGTMFKELQWILDGSVNIGTLGKSKVIWEPWADTEGYLESSYGRYLRSFPPINVSNGHTNESVADLSHSPVGLEGVDQLQQLLRGLLQPKPSRRLHASLWHPDNAFAANQPPCMTGLTLNWAQSVGHRCLMSNVQFRSSDFGIGFCFDIFQWYIVSQLLLTLANKKLPSDQQYVFQEYTFQATNQHLYHDHTGQALAMLSAPNMPKTSPKLVIHTEEPNPASNRYALTALGHTVWFEIVNYNPHPAIKFDMAINDIEF